MEDPKKELIAEIADLLRDHEETYVPGEWEAFVQQKAKPRIAYGYWLQLAAVLLLMLSVFPFPAGDLFRTEKQGSTVSRQGVEPAITKKSVKEELPGDFRPHDNRLHAARPGQQTDGLAERFAQQQPVREMRAEAASDTNISIKQGQQFSPTGVVNNPEVYAAANDTTGPSRKHIMTTAEFLAAETRSKTAQSPRKKEGSKWDFGLMVMPMATGSNMNVGAGITTAYQLSPKIALSSGIALTQLQTGRSYSGSTESVVSLLAIPDKSLLAVNNNIKAIDIPVDLVYKITEHFYTSAGVSFLNILSDRQNSTFTQTSQVSRMATNADGAAFSYSAIQTSQVNEQTTDGALSGSSYVGFFNFSVGRKQNVFGNYKVRIEPFIKVPLGKLSTDDLKLMNSGVKFQFSF